MTDFRRGGSLGIYSGGYRSGIAPDSLLSRARLDTGPAHETLLNCLAFTAVPYGITVVPICKQASPLPRHGLPDGAVLPVKAAIFTGFPELSVLH